MTLYRALGEFVEVVKFNPSTLPWPEGVRAETDGIFGHLEYFLYEQGIESPEYRSKLCPGDHILFMSRGDRLRCRIVDLVSLRDLIPVSLLPAEYREQKK